MLERDGRHGAPRVGRPPRHPAARRPLHAARRPQRLRGSADLRTRRVLRRRAGARAPGPAGGGRDADRDLRPGGARLQPRVLLLPDARTRDRRRHLRGAQVDGGVRRGVGVGHRGAAAVGRRPALLVHGERHPAGRASREPARVALRRREGAIDGERSGDRPAAARADRGRAPRLPRRHAAARTGAPGRHGRFGRCGRSGPSGRSGCGFGPVGDTRPELPTNRR